MPIKILFTEEYCQPENLFPFTLTRQIQDIRIGILTIREKWEKLLGLPSFDKFEDDYKDLDRSIRLNPKSSDEFILIHGNVLPDSKLISAIRKLKEGEFLSVNGERGIAFRFTGRQIEASHKIKVQKAVTLNHEINCIHYPWDILKHNESEIVKDFALITKGRKSQALAASNKLSGPRSGLFIEKEATLEHCIINVKEGPVYIGKNASVMEGSMIKGPICLGEGATLKMGAKIYPATSIGPYCVVGGEVKNSVFFGYSNKAHDGYVGDSVIGEWCNLGAGTSNSNMKNNASEIRVWTRKGEISAGLKCGMFMGDYSRTSINTSVNTGTVIGVSCNVFGNGLTPKFIPSFSWGNEGLRRYELKKALADIEDWKRLKNKTLDRNEKTILTHIFEHY